MPPIAWAWAGSSKPASKPRPELQNPPPHRFIGKLQAALGEEILHVAIAERETKIEPDRVLNDWRRKAMSAIREMGHARTLSDQLLPGDPVAVTLPMACRPLSRQASTKLAA